MTGHRSDTEIEPLTDEALEAVAGGSSSEEACCSCECCSGPGLPPYPGDDVAAAGIA